MVYLEKIWRKLPAEELNNRFQTFVENGYTELVEILIELGADVTWNKNWAIRMAAANGYTEIVKLLIDAGADVTVVSNAPIRVAAEKGYTEIVALLLEAGADSTDYDRQAIEYALKNGHVGVAKLFQAAGLVDIGGSIDAKFLNARANLGQLDMVEYLLANGVKYEDSIIVDAVSSENVELVKLCINSLGVDVTIEDNAAICIAARRGSAEIVKLLIDAGADAAANENRPINHALCYGHIDVIEILVNAGADPEQASCINVRHAVTYFMNDLKKLKKMIDLGFDVNRKLSSMIIRVREPEVIKFWLESNKNTMDIGYISKLLADAVYDGHEVFVDVLISKSVDINYDINYDDHCAIRCAVFKSNTRMVEKLLAAGARFPVDIERNFNEDYIGKTNIEKLIDEQRAMEEAADPDYLSELLFDAVKIVNNQYMASLIKRGADASEVMRDAVFHCKFGVIEKLLAAGARFPDDIEQDFPRAYFDVMKELVEKQRKEEREKIAQ